ncbi:MAG: PrgI family mobile element protein [Candidatus Levyibacteriota bacterium]
MDQHPIPQDVTGFQFKLIGTMTVKQFGYVAVGVIMAVICYYVIPNTVFWMIAKFVLIPLFGGSGVLIAFVPVDGRPIDVMTSNFAKALFSPNQYVYKREGRKLSFTRITVAKPQDLTKAESKATSASMASKRKGNDLDEKEAKLRAFLTSSQGGIKNDLDKKEAAFLKTLTIPSQTRTVPIATTAPAASIVQTPITNTLAQPAPAVPKPVQPLPPLSSPAVTPPLSPALVTSTVPPKPLAAIPTQPLPTSPVSAAQKEAELAQKESQLEQELTKAKQEEAANTPPPVHEAAHQKVETLSKQIQDIHTQKQLLEQELTQLKNQLAVQKGVPTPSVPTITPNVVAPTQQLAQDPQHVRNLPQDGSKKAGLPHVSDTPNVVVGIVKDPRGNILSNILVEVKDKEGNPVRAFKTNPLGQFASATPLSPGTYTMELEDPKKQNRFDIIQITANNQILPAMEVISHDAREDLRKQLFAS